MHCTFRCKKRLFPELYIYTPRKRVCGGVYWIHPVVGRSVCRSVGLSVGLSVWFPDDKSKSNCHDVTKLSEYHIWGQRKVGIDFGQNPKNKMAASRHFENFVSRR